MLRFTLAHDSRLIACTGGDDRGPRPLGPLREGPQDRDRRRRGLGLPRSRRRQPAGSTSPGAPASSSSTSTARRSSARSPTRRASTAIAFVPDLNRGFTSNGGDSTVTVFDLKTLKTLGKVKANGRPDIIYFEPVSRRVFTFNHGTNDITAIDPAEMKVVGTLAAGRRPRAGRLRREGAHLRQPGGHQRDRRVRRQDPEGPQDVLARPRRGADRPGLRRQAAQALQHLRQPEAGRLRRRQRQGRPDPRDRPRPRRLRLRRRRRA